MVQREASPRRPSADDMGALSGAGGHPVTGAAELDAALAKLGLTVDDHDAQLALRRLMQAQHAIACAFAAEDVLRQIVLAAGELVNARYGMLGVFRDGQLDNFVPVGMDNAELTGMNGLPEGGSLMRVPIEVRGETFGTLYLADPMTGRFTDTDAALASTLAISAGIAIEHAQHFDVARRRQLWLAASTEITRELLSEAGADPLKLIVDRAQEVANADVAVIMLPISDHEFAVEASVGVREVDLKTFRIPFGRSLSGVAMAQNQPMLLADASADQRRVDSRAVEGLGPTMFVPFEGSRRGRGVLVLSRTQGREAFTESDLEMAANFANQATLAIQLAQGRSDQNRLGMLEDRSRIARDLHDHVVQRLFASGLGLQGVAATLEVPEIAGRILAHVSELDETIRQIRTTIFNLQEPGPEQRSVRGAVLDLAAQARKVLGFEPQVNFDGPVDTMVEGALADDVTAVVRESLSNIIRHSEASQVALRLSVTAEEVVLVIIDDGVGISDAAGQGGLSNLRQRADSRGGTFKLSHVVGGGTHVCWRVPLATE